MGGGRAGACNREGGWTAASDSVNALICYRKMSNKALLKVGIVGTIVAALWCFTPLLVVLLGAVGLAAVIGWLDLVLLPTLGVFVVITGDALWKHQKARSS